jgi:hypothetical protein
MRRMFLYMRAGGRWRQYGLRKAGRGLQRKQEDNQHQTKPGWGGGGPDGTAWGRWAAATSEPDPAPERPAEAEEPHALKQRHSAALAELAPDQLLVLNLVVWF